jgi:hypothetical protein
VPPLHFHAAGTTHDGEEQARCLLRRLVVAFTLNGSDAGICSFVNDSRQPGIADVSGVLENALDAVLVPVALAGEVFDPAPGQILRYIFQGGPREVVGKHRPDDFALAGMYYQPTHFDGITEGGCASVLGRR